MNYIVNENFKYSSGFTVKSENVLTAINNSNNTLLHNPANLYKTVDLKTTSAILGALFCSCLADSIPEAIVNPIEKGHPDIIPENGKSATEEELRNFPYGLEIKTTVGNVKTGAKLQPGENRLHSLTGITWQAHHQEVKELMGIIWDFDNAFNDFNYPIITGIYFAANLTLDDWGAISGTTGRNTKVCGMTASGRLKMVNGWIAVHTKYYEKYNKLLGKT
jgi:hypothetical protein